MQSEPGIFFYFSKKNSSHDPIFSKFSILLFIQHQTMRIYKKYKFVQLPEILENGACILLTMIQLYFSNKKYEN